jgi:hypothetical protein
MALITHTFQKIGEPVQVLRCTLVAIQVLEDIIVPLLVMK